MVFCSRSRPGRFTQDSGREKKICGALRVSDMPLFWGGAIHTGHKPRVMLQEVSTPYIPSAYSWQGAKIYTGVLLARGPILKKLWDYC